VPTLIFDRDLKDWIIQMVTERLPDRSHEISLESRLFHDLGITGDDADELLTDYVDAFQVDMTGFKFTDYFTSEPPSMFEKWSKQNSPRPPITVGDLVEIAQRGKWVVAAE
jgi:hypothetical protein